MKHYDVIGFGALNVDRLGCVDQVLLDGDAAVSNETQTAGGSAANTIAALGRLDLRVGFIGAVGKDKEGAFLLDAFRKDHVDYSFAVRKPGGTGTLLGVSDIDGHRALYIYPGVNSTLLYDDLPTPTDVKSRYVHLSSFVGTKQLDIQTRWALRLPKSITVTFAPGMLYARLGYGRLKTLLSRCRMLFLTEEERGVLMGTMPLRALFDLGIKTVVVTRGSEGSEVYGAVENIKVPADKTPVVDATGAGDAFIAGFLWGKTKNWNNRDCAVAGNTLAAFVLASLGARDGLPTKREFTKKLPHKYSVLVVGSGGREHAIGWKLRESPAVGEIYFAPGNGGTEDLGENVGIAPTELAKLMRFAKEKKIDLTVVGPEAALAVGLVDRFMKENLTVFGPTRAAARLEASKVWATRFMKRHGLPLPKSQIFDDFDKALLYARQLSGNCVIKADGLCQGKGVFVCDSVSEAGQALSLLMKGRVFEDAGKRIVIQEKLVGQEVSVMAFCDGSRAVPLITAQDYKRVFDDNRGPNTGGMGSIAPSRISPAIIKEVHMLLTRTVKAMKQEGLSYRGILYGGMMIVGNTPYFLEYNCRFGDPETQVQLPLLKSDLFLILYAAASGNLKPSMVRWSRNAAVCVVATSKGYPGAFSTGKAIDGLDTRALVFHAGTTKDENRIKTTGGRVFGVVSTGATIDQARKKAYHGIKNISFSGMHYRRDIGYKN